jgi:hypothetical protein
MAGIIHGSVDHVNSGATPAQRNQELFTWIYNFVVNQLIANGYATMIATQYGTAGTGFDYHDGANPSGENALFLFRMNTSTERPGGGSALGAYYVLVQWADTNAFGAAPGNPGKISNGTGDGVGICAAFREDGTSPWAGTTNNDGTDTKGATVWTPGGSTLHVMERSNSPGGGNVTNKENMNRVIDCGGGNARFHLIGDEDSIILLPDELNDTSYNIVYIGLYDAPSYITASYPLVFLSTSLPMSTGHTYGTVTGNSSQEGLLVTADISGPGDGAWQMDLFDTNIMTAAQQPNIQITPNEFDEQDIPVIARDLNQTLYGLCGALPLAQQTFNVATESANAALDRAAFGSAVVASQKIVTPWGTAGAPNTTSTRAGRQF